MIPVIDISRRFIDMIKFYIRIELTKYESMGGYINRTTSDKIYKLSRNRRQKDNNESDNSYYGI